MRSNVRLRPNVPGKLFFGTLAIAVLVQAGAPASAQSTAESEIAGYQSSVSPGRLFGRASNRSGLQAVGSVSISTEAIFGNINDSSALIGSPDAPQIFGTHFYAASLGTIDGQHVGEAALVPGNVGQTIVDDAVAGVRAELKYRAANNGGLQVHGFWLGESERSWQRGVGGYDAGDEPSTVRATAALPLNDNAGGFAVPYDQFFKIGITTKASGLGADFAPTGFWWGGIMIQPTVGIRYIDLNEQFGFRGADSGLSYTLNSNGLPVESSLDPPNPAFPPYQAFLDVTADNQLIGPTVGLNISTSGMLCRFSSDTRVGGLVNESQQSLAGQGFGNGFAAGFDPSITFSDSRSQTLGTAYFEQTLHLDIELLRLMPMFRSYEMEQSLALRLGWSLLMIDRVARPVESIVWDGFPLTPTLKSEESDWMLQTWNIGLLFQY